VDDDHFSFFLYLFKTETAEDEWKNSAKRSLLGGSRVFEPDFGPPASKCYVSHPSLLPGDEVANDEAVERDEEATTFRIEMVNSFFFLQKTSRHALCVK
jgi:hypothetical protein